MSKHSIQNDPEIQRLIENERIEYLMKSEAIEFAKFVSSDTTLDDFWSMSKELHEKVYQSYKNGKH